MTIDDIQTIFEREFGPVSRLFDVFTRNPGDWDAKHESLTMPGVYCIPSEQFGQNNLIN